MLKKPMASKQSIHESKTKLLDAALLVIRDKGYSATRIEDICKTAGLTKGSFFHHFESKEALALAAANYWIEGTSAMFAAAPYHAHADPLERLLAYVDFRKALLVGELREFTCLVGTMVQEVYATHPALREASERSISKHAATLVPDIEEAMRERGMRGDWTAESLALYTQATLQGKLSTAPRLPHNASTTCATTSNCCSTSPVFRIACSSEANLSVEKNTGPLEKKSELRSET
jgi:TetR/AcrR family transcriptional repressor of nem operon